MTLERIKRNFMDLTSDPVAVGYLGPNGESARLVYVNQAFINSFGYQPNEVIGQEVNILHDPETWDTFTATVQPHFEAKATAFQADSIMRRADGSKFWASVGFIITEGEEPDERYVSATYRDISEIKKASAAAQMASVGRKRALAEQKRINEELEHTRNRLQEAINAYPDPFVIYDSSLDLVCWNEGYERTVTDQPGTLKEGMSYRQVLQLAFDSGTYVTDFDDAGEWAESITRELTEDVVISDIELVGDVHHRLIRSKSATGDYVLIRVDTTEFVRQKRAVDAAQDRLIGALNAYPYPFAIYDSDDRLVVWNSAYRKAMTTDPDGLSVGMHRLETAREAIRCGLIVQVDGAMEEKPSDNYLNNEMDKQVQDMELAGDIHHRLLRSRAENGDHVLLRIDTTELVRQRRDLQKTQDRLMAAISAYPDPFAIYDKDLALAIWNPAYAATLTEHPEKIVAGLTMREVAEIAIHEGKSRAAVGRENEWLDEFFDRDFFEGSIENLQLGENKHYRTVRSPTLNGELVILRFDITEEVEQRKAIERYNAELKTANEEITYKALHDDLTGLGNRRYLSQQFEEMIRRRKEEGGEIAALHIDLDRFKQINDTLGHAAGDQVLLDAAHRIQSCTEPGDIVARIGGDEFTVLLLVTEFSRRPEELADKLLHQMARPSYFEGKECRFGASIGLARTPLAEVDALLTNSDVALYKAKDRGRGQLGIFDQQDLEDLRQSKLLADELLRAAERGEFVPFFQPQVDANTGEVVGMEALARWQHPDRGILAPDAFLDAATELNLAAEIDRMIFESAIYTCQDAFGDLARPPSLSFNVSAKRVKGEHFQAISKYVQAYSGQVSFELLETIFLEEEDHEFLFQLDRLRDLGIAIEVDDFGSGRASVVALQRIGPERLKIDRRLVAHVAESESGLRLARSLVEIGAALEMGITAEGVETKEQAEILAKLGCDRLQGYYFAKPMAFDDLLIYLQEREGLKIRA